MLLFKNYTIQQGDTLTKISQTELGNISEWHNLVSINKLRYPYISDNIIDQLGNKKGEFLLSSSADIGDSSLYFSSSLVSSGSLSPAIFTAGSVIFLQKHIHDGDFVFDKLSISSLYLESSLSRYRVICDFEKLPAPKESLIATGRLSKVIDNTFSSSSREYYMKYAYVGVDGLETNASPYNELYSSTTSTISPETYILASNQYFTYTSPSVFPDGVEAIRLYVGLDKSVLYRQATITVPGYVFSEKSNPMSFSSTTIALDDSPSKTVSIFGLTNPYAAGFTASVYENSSFNNTFVLKTGDILKIPVSNGSVTALIGSAATDSFVSSLGRDIALDDLGRVSFLGENTDLSSVQGIDNLKQALRNRLLTQLGQISLQPNFGNGAASYVGSKYSLNVLQKIRLSIVECLMNDPRVISVPTIDVIYDAGTSSIIANNIAVQISYNGSLLDLNPIRISV